MASTINIPRTAKIHFCGNSITALDYFSLRGGLLDQIGAATPGTPTTATGTSLVGSATVIGSATSRPPYARSPVPTSAGFPGQNITQFAGAVEVAARITSFNPDVLFLETGANDELNVPVAADYNTAYRDVIDRSLTFNPNMKIVVWSCLCLSEDWNAGPVWATVSNRLLPTLMAIPASYPTQVVCIDVNTPTLTWLSTHKASGANGIRIFTLDNIHPNTSGQLWLAQQIMPFLTFS